MEKFEKDMVLADLPPSVSHREVGPVPRIPKRPEKGHALRRIIFRALLLPFASLYGP